MRQLKAILVLTTEVYKKRPINPGFTIELCEVVRCNAPKWLRGHTFFLQPA
jgi:hypothetical protein